MKLFFYPFKTSLTIKMLYFIYGGIHWNEKGDLSTETSSPEVRLICLFSSIECLSASEKMSPAPHFNKKKKKKKEKRTITKHIQSHSRPNLQSHSQARVQR